MKFSCTQENLFKCLTITSHIASRVGNLPILSNIHIKSETNGVKIKATNLEIGVTCTLRASVNEIGEFTVPAKLFTDYVASLPKERIDITLKENSIKVMCGRHNTNIKGMPAAEFPLIPQVENGSVWRVSLPNLTEGLTQVLFAISPTETRQEISGAYLGQEGKHLILVGTDSYRLAEKKLLGEKESGDNEDKVIIPLRALQELGRICGQEKEEVGSVKITIAENQLAVDLPSVQFVSRLIDGHYPDYKAIVPEQFGITAIIPRTEFASAIKAAGLFSKAGVHDVVIDLNPNQNTITVESLNSQTGEHESVIGAEITGGPTKIAFNWKYLLDGFNAFSSNKIVLKATDSASPTMLQEEKGEDYFYIVMPIKE